MSFRKSLFVFTVLILTFINNAFSGNLYWVGNSGNWDNPSHWSNSSGGKGGAGIPTKNDNVFIDQNSFTVLQQTLTINTAASLKNLNINIDYFTLSSGINSSLTIYGSLNVPRVFNNKITCDIHLKSKNTNTLLNFGWGKWNSNIYFEGSGSYALISPIQAHERTIKLVQGTLNLNGNDILCNEFISTSNQKRKLISTNSSILAYSKWETNKTKFNYDFSDTKIYVISSNAKAVNIGSDNYFIKQSKNSLNDKLITEQPIADDTVSCGNACDGILIANFTTTCPTATVDWLPGPGVDTYAGECITCPINGPNAADTIFDLCPGFYTAVISNSCDGDVKAPQGEVRGHPTIVPFIQNVVQTSCNDSCDGSINISVTGASYAIFSYQWLPPLDSTERNSFVNNLCAGTYSIEVKDGFGCIDTFEYNVPEPLPISPNVSVTNVSCFGECTGAAISSPSGGNGGYNFSWFPNGATTPGITGLCIGSIDSLYVTDINGCSGDTTITVTGPNQIQLDTLIQNVSCGGVCDGEITTTILSGGTAPFTHHWSTGQVDIGAVSTISNLCFGTYTDSIVDGNGCDTVITIIITEPTPLTTSSLGANVTCFNACDGFIKTTTSGGTAPYNYIWSSIPPGGVTGGQGSDSIFSLCPADYIVNITDNQGCITADTITITEPDLLVANLDSTNTSCASVCDGSVTSLPTGGTSPYTYSWAGPGGPYNTQSPNSLCAGLYIVTVSDSAGRCSVTDSINITEPSLLVLTMSSTDMSCNGVCNGTANVVVTGGTLPYNYFWVSLPGGLVGPGQGSDNITNLCAGNYTVNISDNQGCTANNNVIVNEPAPVLGNLTSTNTSCNATCDGTATVTPTGGNAPYQVSWNGGAFLNITGSRTETGLCAGPQTAVIRDNNNCQTTINFNISEPAVLLTNTTGTPLTCNNICSGTATTNPSGGTAPYSYSWSGLGAPFPNSSSIGSLCAGTYTVTITDDSLCTVIDSVTIIEPVNIDPNPQTTNVTCNGANDGTAISLPLGGTPPYTSITWTTIGGAPVLPTGNPVNNLSAGQYIVTVSDVNGCSGIDTITITEPLALTVDAISTNASCGTICDGVITATASGGALSYTYTWDDPNMQTTPSASNLCSGIYTVTVTDTNGCIATDSDTVNNLVTIIINTGAVNNGCNTICDGIAVATPGGGATPYVFQWSDPNMQVTDTAFNLCQGLVYVTVTDNNGCTSRDSALVPAAPNVFQLNSTSTAVNCNNSCDGTATISPSGGIPPYTWVWSNGNTTDLSINSLCAGTYSVTGTDSAGCQITDTLIIIEPDTITPNPTIINVDCNSNSTGSICLSPSGGTPGYTYLWAGGLGTDSCITNQPAGNYTVTINDTNSCSRIENYTITEPVTFSSNPISVDVSCFGLSDGMAAITLAGGIPPYSCTWNTGATTDTIFNLIAGTYSVICTDSNGCTTTQNIIINEPSVLLANVTGTSIACGGTPCTGTASSTPTGGTPGYTYQWTTNGVPISTTDSIFNLCQDTFNLVVTDTNGCVANGTYIVTTPSVLSVTLDSTNISCNNANDGTVTATPTGGTPPYTYSWVGGCLTTPDTNAVVTNLCAGTYTVTVTDSLGCFFIGSINIINPSLIDDNEIVTLANCGFCDGVITVNPSGGTPPYAHSWSNGFNGSTNTGLCAGFYTDTITDFNGCVEIFTISVSNPTGPSGVATTVNDINCYNGCDGALNVIPIGGTAPFSYSWTGPNAPHPNDSTLINLCTGTYNLTLTDAVNCIFATSIIVNQSDSIIENSSSTNPSCNGLCDGIASVSPTGGTAPYTYLWSDGSTGSSISNLCAGVTSVTITDFNGCSKIVNFNMTSPNILTLSSSITNTLCNNSCNGSATVNPSGGTTSYTYQWNDPLSQTTQTATGLCIGDYIVTVTDINGCSANDTVTINEPSPIIPNEITTLASCGNNDGTITLAPSGGTPGYTYNWPSLGLSIPNPVGLSAGTYIVEITDNNNCMQSFPIIINNTSGPIVSVNSTNASCNGLCNGSASATITSGASPFSYLWSNGATTSSITGLCAGTYTVQVTDANGCISVSPVSISDNTLITATVNTTDATCNGSCDGSALIIPSGGVPPYSYNWSSGQTINAVGGLCAGNYTVTITDATGCSVVESITIDESATLSVNITGNNVSCNGGSDGSANVVTMGGTAPYSYLWSNNSTTPTIVGLVAGTYSVIVTDVNGCSAVGNIIIGEGSLINTTITTTDATCGVCDGTATATTPTGGAGGAYSYLWLPGGQTTQSINNLCPGSYSLNITDNVGCSQSFNFIITNPTGPSITTTSDSVTCFGVCDGLAWTVVNGGAPPYTYQWDDPLLTTNDSVNSLCAGYYSVIVQDNLGCISVDTTTVLEPQEILANITYTSPSCPNICDGTATVNPNGGVGTLTYLWSNGQTTPTATGLCSGTYSVTLTDEDGCMTIDSITLTDPTPINITLNSTLPTCNSDCDATILANASGGTPGYTFSWNTTPIQNNSLATSLCAGAYIVTVTDNNGCSDTASVIITDPAILSTSSTVTDVTCNGSCDGTITTNPVGGFGPYSYIWNTSPIQTTQTATGLCAGTYYVTIFDMNNCSVNDTLTITEPSPINDSTIVTGPTCGICDGSATSTPVGGVGPYDFTWTDPLNTNPSLPFSTLGQPSSTVVGLCAGTVDLQITDLGTGCIYNYTVIVNSATGPNTIISSSNETCIASCDGSATVNVSGGFPPYSFSWTPTTPLITDSIATGLCANFYTVTVTDALGCISSDTVTITTNGLNLNITSIIPESCFGSCDGSATVATGAGTAPFTYLWSPTTPTQTTPTATGLCVGLYTATVTDSLACSDSIGATISGPTMLSVSATVNSPISCNNVCDGSVIATVTGGTLPYTYLWNDPLGQTTPIATGLCAGTYIVTIIDNNNCTTNDTITITEPTAITANELLTLPACNVCDGAITINPTGGVGPFTFLWTTPSSPPNPVTNTINNLCAGAYSVDITDLGTGCVSTFNFPLNNSNAPIINTNVTNISCNGLCDGEITSNISGGTPPFSYSWNPSAQTTPNATGLCAGVYDLTVTDALGCIGVAIDSVTEPEILQVNLNSSNISCNGLMDGWIIARPNGGALSYTYSWSPNGQTVDSITNLTAGTYIVTVTDTNGCSVVDSTTLTEPTAIISISSQTDVSCSSTCDGDASVNVSGGSGPYTYQWNGDNTPGQISSITNICMGLNTVLIIDQNGCSIIDSINIGAIDTVIANAGNDRNVCEGISFNLIGTSTGTISNVEWFELPGMNSVGNTDTVLITPNGTGTRCYVYQITGSCTSTDTVCITIDPNPNADAGPDVNIFEGTSTTLNASGGGTYLWSPGNSLNDSTIANPIASPMVTTDYIVMVTSPSGCISYDTVTVTVLPKIEYPDGITPNGDGKNDLWIIDFIEEFPNNVVEIYNRWGELLFRAENYQQNWDGTYNGKELPIGTYYYIIDLNSDLTKPITGPITILR